MPALPQTIQRSLFEIQNFCKEQNEDCDNCRLKSYCDHIHEGRYLSDLDIAKTDIVLGCDNKHICAEYIVMKSSLMEQLNKIRAEKELAVAQRDAYENALDELCPGWKHRLADKIPKAE